MWMNFQREAVESSLAQGLSEFSKAQKLGTNWRWEERGGWWMCTAAPGFGRGDRPGQERQPSMEGSQRGEDRQIAPGGARSLRFGRDDREAGWDDKPQTGGEQRGMTPKDCKRLAEVDFPIAVVSRHFRRGRSPSGMDIVHLWWARRPPAAWSCSYPSSRPFFLSSRPERRDLAPPGAIPSAQLIPAPQDSYLHAPGESKKPPKRFHTISRRPLKLKRKIQS